MPMQAQRGGEGVPPTHSQSDTRKGSVVSITLRPRYSRGQSSTLCTGGWVVVGLGLDSMEKHVPYRGSIHRASSL
jgi:hypothetical protein